MPLSDIKALREKFVAGCVFIAGTGIAATAALLQFVNADLPEGVSFDKPAWLITIAAIVLSQTTLAILFRVMARMQERHAQEIREYSDKLEQVVVKKTLSLQDSEDRAKRMFDIVQGAPASIAALDLQGNVTEWNPASVRLFGWSTEDVVGKVLPTITDTDKDEFTRMRRHIAEGRILEGAKARRKRKDGAVIEVKLWASPLRNPQGKVVGTVLIHGTMADASG
jgi:PAS domain S-box-containing protein